MRTFKILIVDDSPSDVLLTREALEAASLPIELYAVDNGVEAMAFLHRQNGYARAPRVDLVLLDLNLPMKSGREVLAELKWDERLRSIPVIVLTSSAAEEDIAKAYGLHANCYITKPADFDGFNAVIQAIERFWFQVVTMPKD